MEGREDRNKKYSVAEDVWIRSETDPQRYTARETEKEGEGDMRGRQTETNTYTHTDISTDR